MGKAGITGHQLLLSGTSLKSKLRNPEISGCHPHGQSRWVPRYPGSLRVSENNLPTWGNGRDGSSDQAKAMLVLWPCKLLVLKTQALVWLTLDKALPGQLNRNEKLVSVWAWKRWLGHRSHVGLGGMHWKKDQVPLRKSFLGFCGSYSWEMQSGWFTTEGNGLSFTLLF